MHPILFEIGTFTVRSYGALVALSFLISFYLLHGEAKRKNFYPDKIPDMTLAMLIFGIIGARLLHVAVNLDYYKSHSSEIALIWRGGLAVYGGILFAIIAGWAFAVKNKIPFLKTSDLVVPYVALGQSIGRIGCFLNGCCFGRDDHPVQLYAALALLSVFVILRLAGQKRHRPGFIFGLYMVLYTAQRFAIDFLRGDTPRYLFGLTVSQLISVALFFTGLVFLVRKKHWKR